MAAIVQQVQAALGAGVVPPTVGSKLSTGIKLKEFSVANADVSLDDLPGKNVIVGVPGAFTPTCSSQVPEYISEIEKFQAKGIENIYVVSVNDAFVTKAWGEKLNPEKKKNVRFLADDSGKFTAAIGMAFDASAFLGGSRSHRYAIYVEDGIVKHVEQESNDGETSVTGASHFLSKL